MTKQEWLDTLKVGDEVYRDVNLGMGQILKVTNSTPTQIHVGSEKFRRDGGRKINSSRWDFVEIEPVTEAIRAKVRRELNIRLIRAWIDDTKKISDEALEQVANIARGNR